MECNKLKIVDYSSEGKRPIEQLFLNGNKLDYVIDYSIIKKPNESTVLTLVIDCEEIELVKGNLEKEQKK